MLINNIVPFSHVDGPGNRLVVFVQECNLNCLYCHNFETINKCIHCLECVATCPSGALTTVDNKVDFDPLLCTDCDACIFTCRFNSTPKAKEYSVEQMVKMIISYKDFIDGVTFSGGECTIYHQEISEIAKELNKENIEVLIDTNGFFELDQIMPLVENVKGFMIDIKTINNTKELIESDTTNLDNVDKLIALNKVTELRTVDLKDNESKLTIDYIDKLISKHPNINKRVNKLAIVKTTKVRKEKLENYMNTH